MLNHKKSLSEVFGNKVPFPPKPMKTSNLCPFISEICKKSAGIDDDRLRPSGACSIWFNCNFLEPSIEKPIIICPHRFYTKSHFHLWSLVEKLISNDVTEITLIPEVVNIDWVIYSENDEILGAIEVQSMDTTGSYKPQLFYLRDIKDPSSSQYPNTVNANWANATYKRFYPQVLQTIATMDQFNAPVGLVTQDIFKPYLENIGRFPLYDTNQEINEVTWLFLKVDDHIGTTKNMIQDFLYFSKQTFKDIILKFSHPTEDIVHKAIKRQIKSGKGIKYIDKI